MGPLQNVFVKARQRPRSTAGRLLLEGFVQGSRGGRQNDAPSWLVGVGGGHVDHRFQFALQFDQPCQDVIQQHRDSPLKISCTQEKKTP